MIFRFFHEHGFKTIQGEYIDESYFKKTYGPVLARKGLNPWDNEESGSDGGAITPGEIIPQSLMHMMEQRMRDVFVVNDAWESN